MKSLYWIGLDWTVLLSSIAAVWYNGKNGKFLCKTNNNNKFILCMLGIFFKKNCHLLIFLFKTNIFKYFSEKRHQGVLFV